MIGTLAISGIPPFSGFFSKRFDLEKHLVIMELVMLFKRLVLAGKLLHSVLYVPFSVLNILRKRKNHVTM